MPRKAALFIVVSGLWYPVRFQLLWMCADVFFGFLHGAAQLHCLDGSGREVAVAAASDSLDGNHGRGDGAEAML